MLEDEIVEETRRLREEYAAKFDYDLDAIYEDLKEQEERGAQQVVSLRPKEPATFPHAKAS